MAGSRPFTPWRRLLVGGAVALAVAAGGSPAAGAVPTASPGGPSLSVPAGGSPSEPGSGADMASAQAAADRVDLQIAALAGQLEAAQAQATATDLAETEMQNRLDLARADAGALLAEAYVDEAPDSDVNVPAPYLDAARRVVYSALARYQTALAQIRSDQAGARAELDRLQSIQDRLADQKQRLDAIVGADQAALQRAEDADAPALAQSDAARSSASTHLGPIRLAATEAQQKVMAAWPFGPVAGGALPAGLSYSGSAITGVASWYGPGFDGQPTATGAVYDEDGWTVASPWLPLGSFLVVTAGDRSVLLLVNDRGPYVAGRVLDLSHAAAAALGSTGLVQVTARLVVPVATRSGDGA